MLDGLLGRGFSSKCKSSIKLIIARVDEIRRKRNSMQKFLKKDIADLLAHGLDINAYGRAEGLLIELNLSSCYDSVEQFCGCIPRHLSVMQKQRECPEECREAVSSLMFAAARFAMPELRDIRQIFTERYGNALESFVDQEFVKKLSSKPPTKDKKLQLMREIAQEFSIKWDSKAFEQELSNPPASEQGEPRRHGSFHDPNNDGNKQQDSRDNTASKRGAQDISSRGRQELTDDERKPHRSSEETVVKRDNNQYISSRGRQQLNDDGYKLHYNGREETILKRDNQDLSSRQKWELTDDGFRPSNGREEILLKRDNQDNLSRGKQENTDVLSHGRREFTDDGFKSQDSKEDTILKRVNLDDSSHGRRKHFDDDHNTAHKRDNQDISPIGRHECASGYRTKQKVKTHGKDVPFAGDNHNGLPNRTDLVEKVTEEAESMKPHYNNLIPPPYVKPNGGKYGTGGYATSDRNKASTDPPALNRDIANDERQVVGTAQVSDYGDENGQYRQDDLVHDEKPKPRSVRRRHLKPPPGYGYSHNLPEGDGIVIRNPIGSRKEDARRGLQHDIDRDVRDEEEEVMDRLLIHYSKKPSKFEPIRARDVADTGESQRHRSRGLELVPPPARAVSLPPEPVTPPTEGARGGPARAASFQPEMLNPAGHVHPKLPDYNDLAARFASLRGR